MPIKGKFGGVFSKTLTNSIVLDRYLDAEKGSKNIERDFASYKTSKDQINYIKEVYRILLEEQQNTKNSLAAFPNAALHNNRRKTINNILPNIHERLNNLLLQEQQAQENKAKRQGFQTLAELKGAKTKSEPTRQEEMQYIATMVKSPRLSADGKVSFLLKKAENPDLVKEIIKEHHQVLGKKGLQDLKNLYHKQNPIGLKFTGSKKSEDPALLAKLEKAKFAQTIENLCDDYLQKLNPAQHQRFDL